MSKSIYIVFLFCLGAVYLSAQRIGNLNGIYYQAVAIDDEGKEIVGIDIDNKPLRAKTIGVRFAITKGLNGAIQWEETHATNTDKFGLFNLIIGKGTLTGKGSFSKMLDIPWIDADQFLKVEIALKNDGNYKLVSNQQFMSVPYSFYTDDIADNAITTEKILDSAILNRDISTNAIDSRTILQETILAEDIDTNAVTTSEILDSTIINRDLRTSSVDTRTLLDSTILNRDISTSAVDSRTLLDSSIINQDINTGAVDSRTILDTTINAIDIKTSAVNTRIIANGTIINEDIADSTIDLTTKVTGILPLKNGGIGNTVLRANSLLVSNADSTAIISLTPATDGQIPVGVTGGAPTFKIISGKNGIEVIQKADSIIIAAPVTGIFTAELDSISIDEIQFLGSWISEPLTLPGVKLGTIIHGALNTDLRGCQISIYVTEPDTIRISIFNGTGITVNLGENRKIRLLVMN